MRIIAALLLLGQAASASVPEIPFKEVRGYRFTVELEIRIPKKDVGKKISVWAPLPVEDRAQKLLKVDIKAPWPDRLTTERTYGNRMVYIEGRTTHTLATLLLTYDVERHPYKGFEKKSGGRYLDPSRYLGPNKMVPFYPLFKQLAEKEGAPFKTSSQKIRAYYDYVVKTMKYDKSGTGWGRGDAVWACSAKRGNCTDFHSLFIGMSRSQKIPARFEIGFPIPYDKKSGSISGYHCWAQAYAKDLKKWIPIDSTEAKKTGKKDQYFGALPSNRIHFSQGRDIVLNPRQKGKPLNYFIYPYAELDGKPLTTIQKKFRFTRAATVQSPKRQSP